MNKKVRLSDEQIITIKQLAKKLFNSDSVWVFGSRADINKRGGDIDIYLQTDEKHIESNKESKFLQQFYQEFGL